MVVPVTTVVGRVVALPGSDVDTDRIIPARFLKCTRFDGLGEHVFADDRAALGGDHPFDRPEHQGARILVTNRNFGCGSSREHAPQALRRWGIAAIVAESFAEIFHGNCLALGIPCLSAAAATVAAIQETAQQHPGVDFAINVTDATLCGNGDDRWQLALQPAAQSMLISGRWDATGLLLNHDAELQATAQRLPYLRHFAPVGQGGVSRARDSSPERVDAPV